MAWVPYQQRLQPGANHVLQVDFVLRAHGLFVLPPLRHEGPLHVLGLLDEGPQLAGEGSWKGRSSGEEMAVRDQAGGSPCGGGRKHLGAAETLPGASPLVCAAAQAPRTTASSYLARQPRGARGAVRHEETFLAGSEAL